MPIRGVVNLISVGAGDSDAERLRQPGTLQDSAQVLRPDLGVPAGAVRAPPEPRSEANGNYAETWSVRDPVHQR